MNPNEHKFWQISHQSKIQNDPDAPAPGLEDVLKVIEVSGDNVDFEPLVGGYGPRRTKLNIFAQQCRPVRIEIIPLENHCLQNLRDRDPDQIKRPPELRDVLDGGEGSIQPEGEGIVVTGDFGTNL